jgi:hypothetical protein
MRVSRRRVAIAVIAAAVVLAGASVWIVAAAHEALPPDGVFIPRETAAWSASGGRAVALRRDALRRAQVRLATPERPALDLAVTEPTLTCRFLAGPPRGTSPKFDCVLDGGEVIKVKYGRNAEIPAEVAATRLLSALGFPADRMSIVSRLRCHGCPRYPFMAMRLIYFAGAGALFPPHGADEGYSEFQWAAVERKFAGVPLEAGEEEGWGWWELDAIEPGTGAAEVDRDALRLLAAFLAHWDNKSSNQRLLCLDAPGAAQERCGRPLAMVQDLGATFGPEKVDLARWASSPLWDDRRACTISMRHLPYGGATFGEAHISEAARLQVARHLGSIPDDQIAGLFAAARFPDYYSGSDEGKVLAAWTAAFHARVRHISDAGPCPR